MGDALFRRKKNLDLLWQELALNFYPERANFTVDRTEGEEFSDHLFASYPVLARRELGNLFAANLRPRSSMWLEIHVDNEDLDSGDHERKFLEHLTKLQWEAMYSRRAGFVRCTKQTDHDFAAFGNGVIRFGPNMSNDGLLYRNYHLRDNAWSENAEGIIDVNHRKWKPTARQLKHHFGDKISKEVEKAYAKDPEKEFSCRHVVLPTRLYPYKSKTGREFPFVSLYIECESENVLEEKGLNYFCYVIPRWQTVSDSQYGVSMATCIALPDGRTMQVVTRTIREAGEKYVDPPMIAISDAIRGDYALYAGGVTTADIEYDERLGDVLRPVNQDRGGMPIGFEIQAALKEDLRHGFMLDKIQLPEAGKDMTAFEVRRRVEEHIRSSAPIFEPVIEDYNDPLCDGTFTVMRDMGLFPMDQMPDSLQDVDVKFKVRNPLADMADQTEADVYVDVMNRIVAPAAQIDPAELENVDLTEATRDAMRKAGFKAKWFKPKEAVEERRAEMAQQAQANKAMEEIGAAGQVAEQSGKGLNELMNAGVDGSA
jgi:hypothetical protein